MRREHLADVDKGTLQPGVSRSCDAVCSEGQTSVTAPGPRTEEKGREERHTFIHHLTFKTLTLSQPTCWAEYGASLCDWLLIWIYNVAKCFRCVNSPASRSPEDQPADDRHVKVHTYGHNRRGSLLLTYSSDATIRLK